jgi:hypothetical protein
MRYTVTTFKVRLEVAESGIRIRNSETAEIVARGIFNRLDADKDISWRWGRIRRTRSMATKKFQPGP